MPQLRIDADGFNLNSRWTCWWDGENFNNGKTDASEATNIVTFTYDLPTRAKITSAKVHSVWKGTLCGFAAKTVAGIEPDAEGFVSLEDVDPSATALSVEFYFVAQRDDDPYCAEDAFLDSNEVNHTSSAIISEVYLLIEYEEDKGGYIYHAENGVLVPYNFYRAEGGVLVPYYMFGAPHDYEIVTQNLLTADGENLRTSDDKQFKVTGGE